MVNHDRAAKRNRRMSPNIKSLLSRERCVPRTLSPLRSDAGLEVASHSTWKMRDPVSETLSGPQNSMDQVASLNRYSSQFGFRCPDAGTGEPVFAGHDHHALEDAHARRPRARVRSAHRVSPCRGRCPTPQCASPVRHPRSGAAPSRSALPCSRGCFAAGSPCRSAARPGNTSA